VASPPETSGVISWCSKQWLWLQRCCRWLPRRHTRSPRCQRRRMVSRERKIPAFRNLMLAFRGPKRQTIGSRLLRGPSSRPHHYAFPGLRPARAIGYRLQLTSKILPNPLNRPRTDIRLPDPSRRPRKRCLPAEHCKTPGRVAILRSSSRAEETSRWDTRSRH